MIKNIVAEKPLPVYGRGENIRDWLYVEDHVEAIDLILHKGKPGETFTLGGNNEMENIDLIHLLIERVDERLNRPKGTSLPLIKFIKDRLGHDFRYAIDASKVKNELGWKTATSFDEGIVKTVAFYLKN